MAEINPLVALDEAGTSVWLDYIRRKLVESGELQRMVDEDGLRGMTSNPTIFEKAISGSSDYDVQIRDLAEADKDALEIFQIIATDDIRDACDVLRPIYDRLERKDGYVSVEVSPAAANDTATTLKEARHLWQLVDRPNVMIKVPGTQEGLAAIETLISEGINVNITLLFNVERYAEVAERYIRGLEMRMGRGEAIDHIGSVASFFVSRVDTMVDKMLDEKIAAAQDETEKGRLKDLQGKAAIANAKEAYARFEQLFSGSRWQKLAEKGAMVQRPLWASTSTKNPKYRDVIYIEELIGPNTVNTMPQATMTAFKDHGLIRDSLHEGLDVARETLKRLGQSGIDMDSVTRQLEIDGVNSFADSFTTLLECIDAEKAAIAVGKATSESESLGRYQAAVEGELQKLTEEKFVQRLWEKDGSLWSSSSEEQAQIRDALGWLNIVDVMREHVDALEAFATEVQGDGFTHAVVLGMGGSSLCPDVLAHTFHPNRGGLKMHVLDSTHPDAVRAVTGEVDLRRTLFIVSSKSGTTTEPLAFFHYFWSLLEGTGVADAGSHFVAITDPGTPLETTARDYGFRRVFPGAADIGGRYSALSNFGMVPAAVMGVDIRQLLDRAETMVQASQPCVAPRENPGIRLGAIEGVLANSGINKVTLALSPEISTIGWWIEQLIAESTGKSGRGILPVEGEALGSPEVYGPDRLFISVRLRAPDGTRELGDDEGKLQTLAEAGHPVVVLDLPDIGDLGAEFFLWEIATATAGNILGINAFNQPNVQESKDNTKRLLEEYEKTGNLPAPPSRLTDGPLTIWGPAGMGEDVETYLSTFLNGNLKAGGYVAIMAYVQPTDSATKSLNRIRLEIRDRYRVATTVGYGPRFLHSTGQLHKGGPEGGVFIQMVGSAGEDLTISGEPFSFGTLIAAQSLGDFEALQQHERPVVRIDLGSNTLEGLRRVVGCLAGVKTA